MITAQSVFEDSIIWGGIILFIPGLVMLFISYKIKKDNKSTRIVALFFILYYFFEIYNAIGLRYLSTETIGETIGIRLAYRTQVIDYKYEFEGTVLEGHTSLPDNNSNILLNGGKYKIHVFKSFISHETWIDFSKPVK